MAIVLIGTLDTKGREIGFVRDQLRGHGAETVVIDAGCLGSPSLPADVTREEVFETAGTSLAELQAAGDRGNAVTLAAKGVRAVATDLCRRGKVDAVLGLGGSAGTTIASAAMRALPFGVPKVMVSTLASGQTRPFVGPKDIVMFHSVTDILGINRLSRTILSNAAAAVLGMVQNPPVPSASDRSMIAATMFGVTTPCVEACSELFESRGFEPVVFHAVGTGGEAMESLIADGLIAGVLDVTTTELADELVGGVLSAGPDRLTAAAKAGVPQVVSVGALDMVNFGPRDTVPSRFADRKFYVHNENVTLMRTTPEENRRLGEIIADKLNQCVGPAAVFLPLKGVSAIDVEGKPFHDPQADAALFEALRSRLDRRRAELIECDDHINSRDFAAAMVEKLTGFLPRPA